jgi:hypothetical protein
MDLMMMERVVDRQGKMERSCSTGQSPQWAVVPVEEEVTIHPKDNGGMLSFSEQLAQYTAQQT